MKKKEVCQKRINEFNQNKRHEFGSRKLIILVLLTPWIKIIRTEGQNVALGATWRQNNESALKD